MSAPTQLVYQIAPGQYVLLTQEDGTVTYEVQGGGTEEAPCMWFALCERPAVTTEYTSFAGDVPICEPCHTKLFALKS